MTTPENPPPGGDEDPGRGMSGVQRAGIVLGALGVLLIVFVILQGGDDSGNEPSSSARQTTATQTTTATTETTATGSTTEDSTTGPTTEDDRSGGSGSETSGTDDSGSETGTTQTTPSAPAVPTIRVVNGRPQGGVERLEFEKGDRIRFKVTSDVADEVHVHGYDLSKNVTAGGSVSFSFDATIEGRFEIELENAHTQIAELEVDPS